MLNTFNKNILLSNEQQRLDALRRYRIFNTEAEKSFKNIARLVTEIFNVSIAMISLVDDQEVSFQLAEDCGHHIRTSGKFDIVVEGATDTMVHADEQQIEQVLINYLNNAVKYAPDSKVIRIVCEDLQDTLKVSVVDQGPGISAKLIPHVFD